MNSRVAALTLALALVIAVTTGCQPEPQPSPSGPVFANEDEAFAAAEETYRAYVDALNQVDLSDPETVEPVLIWTVGTANEQDRQGYERLRDSGATVSGESVVLSASHESAIDLAAAWTVILGICLDVSTVELIDANGQSIVDAGRPDVQAIDVQLVSAPTTSTGMAIAETGPTKDIDQCSAP